MPIVIKSALTNEADNLKSYTKQQFHSGDILRAAQLNAMDDQIAANTTTILQKLNAPEVAGTSGQVLTSDGSGGQSWQTPAGGEITEALKAALLELAQKVAYIDNSGPQVYQALYRAINGESEPATVISISAALNLGTHTVYVGDNLNSLSPYLIVTATYSDETTKTLNSNTYTLSGSLTTNPSVVTIAYQGKITTVNVPVETPVALVSISVSFDSEHTVYAGDNLNTLKSYLTVTALYSDESTVTLSADAYTLSGDLSSAGTTAVAVSYGGKTDSFTVTVEARTLVSISASFDSGHTVYAGDSLDSLKPYLTVTAAYNNGTTATVNADAYILSGDLSAAGMATVTASYGGKTTTFTVTVEADPYTPNVLYSNYTAQAARFSTNDVTINFAGGDYIKAKIDATACTQNNENILCVGTAISAYDSAVAYLFYWRDNKVLVRLKDVEAQVSVDKWITPADASSITLRIDKDGVYVDGNIVSGITSANTANLNGKGTYSVGSTLSKLTTAHYDYITVYNKN